MARALGELTTFKLQVKHAEKKVRDALDQFDQFHKKIELMDEEEDQQQPTKGRKRDRKLNLPRLGFNKSYKNDILSKHSHLCIRTCVQEARDLSLRIAQEKRAEMEKSEADLEEAVERSRDQQQDNERR